MKANGTISSILYTVITVRRHPPLKMKWCGTQTARPMIAHGDIDPMIVVTPSYNYGQPTPDYADADPYCRALPIELVNDLIPAVEGRYHTYAETTDREGIEVSRSHRAIGGFQWEQSPLGMPLMKH